MFTTISCFTHHTHVYESCWPTSCYWSSQLWLVILKPQSVFLLVTYHQTYWILHDRPFWWRGRENNDTHWRLVLTTISLNGSWVPFTLSTPPATLCPTDPSYSVKLPRGQEASLQSLYEKKFKSLLDLCDSSYSWWIRSHQWPGWCSTFELLNCSKPKKKCVLQVVKRPHTLCFHCLWLQQEY